MLPMRRLIAWMAGLAGVAAPVKLLRQRPLPTAPAPGPPPAGDPAEELRRKLAEARASATTVEPTLSDTAVAEHAEPAGGETADAEPDGPSIEERRADV